MVEDDSDHLRAGIATYLGGDERLEWQLTNRRSGVVREFDGDERASEPADDGGAVAAISDRRIIFLVGGADDGDDDVTSVPHGEIAGVATSEDLLACDLVVTTGIGATWRFTARETETLSSVVADVDERIAGGSHVHAAIERARDHRNTAEQADDLATIAAAYDEAVEAYRDAVDLQTAPAVSATVDIDALRAEVVRTIDAAIESQMSLAREQRSRGNWMLQAGQDDEAGENFAMALDAFDRAIELAETCPPGEPAELEPEREDLVTKLESIDLRAPIPADDD